jgi:hypothetical protein
MAGFLKSRANLLSNMLPAQSLCFYKLYACLYNAAVL